MSVWLCLTCIIGVVLITSGALRPVRFILVDTSMGGPRTVVLMSETGDIVPITQPHELTLEIVTFENQIAWVNYDEEVVVWSHGQRQQIGQLWGFSADKLKWSTSGQLAWLEMTLGTVDLMVWDGERVHNVAPYPENVSRFTWISPQELAWIQARPDSQWQLMTWHGYETTERYHSSLPTDEFRAYGLDCGAFVVGSSRPQIYYGGQMMSVPETLISAQTVTSDNCRTFLFKNVSSEGASPGWHTIASDGTTTRKLDFPVGDIRGDDEFIGAEIPVQSTNTLIQYYQHGTQIQQHSWQAPDPIAEANFLFWEDENVFWRAGTPLDGIYILQWNTATDELIAFPTSYLLTGVYAYDETGRRAAWLDFPQPSVIRLDVWENDSLSHHDLTFSDIPVDVAQSSVRWMNDDSLLIMLQLRATSTPHPLYTAFYRWDGSALEHITDMPFGARPLSDWMIWE